MLDYLEAEPEQLPSAKILQLLELQELQVEGCVFVLRNLYKFTKQTFGFSSQSFSKNIKGFSSQSFSSDNFQEKLSE